jgi:hypothetical protein
MSVTQPPISERLELVMLRRLVEAQNELLACYRLGKRPSGKLLDELRAVKKGLEGG